jgi:hypothetical protein
MGGGGFLLLKAGDSRPESSKQAEIRLTILLKILHIRRFRRQKSPRQGRTDMEWLYLRRFPLDMANSPQSGGFVI